MSAVNDTAGNTHVVYVNRNQDVVHYKKDVGFNDSWSRVSAGINLPARAVGKVGLTALASGRLILFYSDILDDSVYFRFFDGSNWGSESVLKTDANDVNSSFGTMESASATCAVGVAWNEGALSPFDVVFSLGFGDCAALSPSEGAGTVTVTAPSSFEMRFNAARGGGLDQFFDLAEDPARSYDLSGRPSLNFHGLFHSSIVSGGLLYTTGTNSTGGKLDLLEATPTRVRVRQESFFERVPPSTGILPGIKGVGDYSVLSQRVAIRWNRKTTASVPQSDHPLEIGVHREPGPDPRATLTPLSQSGGVFPAPAGDDFVLAQWEVPGVRTDILAIQYSDWALADSLTAATTAAYFSWRDTTVQVLPAGLDEKFNFLVHYKPTNLADNTDPAVLSRRDDYRTPDTLAVAVGKGSGWFHASENTVSPTDFFNESEGAYLLEADPSNGLEFDIDGSVAGPRYHPFFKIRKWRSLADPWTVTFEGSALVNDTDFLADVKPVSRAHWANTLSWHCSVHSATACDAGNLDVGESGSQTGTVIVAGRYGNAAEFDANTDSLSAGTAAGLDFNAGVGAVEFWYQPYYASDEAAPPRRVLWINAGTGGDYFAFEKTTAGELKFTINNNGGVSASSTVSVGNFSWRANDWIHVRTSWKNSGLAADRVKIVLNGVTPTQTVVGTYDAIGINKGVTHFGGCAGPCPGPGNGNALGATHRIVAAAAGSRRESLLPAGASRSGGSVAVGHVARPGREASSVHDLVAGSGSTRHRAFPSASGRERHDGKSRSPRAGRRERSRIG